MGEYARKRAKVVTNLKTSGNKAFDLPIFSIFRSVLLLFSTDEVPSLRMESFAIMTLRGVFTRLNII